MMDFSFQLEGDFSKVDGVDEPIVDLCASVILRGLHDLTLKDSKRWQREAKESAALWFEEAEFADREPFSLAWCCQVIFDDSWKFHFKLIKKTAKEIVCGGRKLIKSERQRKKLSSATKLRLVSTS